MESKTQWRNEHFVSSIELTLERQEGDLTRGDTHTMIPSFPAGGRYQQETVDTVSGVNRGTVYKGKDRVLGDHKVLRVFPTRWATAVRAGEQFQEPEFRKNLAIGWEPGDKPALTHCLLQSLNPTGSQKEEQRSQPLGHRSGEGWREDLQTKRR